jgi:hypothetical protein
MVRMAVPAVIMAVAMPMRVSVMAVTEAHLLEVSLRPGPGGGNSCLMR